MRGTREAGAEERETYCFRSVHTEIQVHVGKHSGSHLINVSF